LAELSSGDAGRLDTLTMLWVSVGGLAGGGILQHLSPVRQSDLATGLVLGTVGGLAGALAPSISEPRWDGLSVRRTRGGVLAGSAGGMIAGTLLSQGLDISA